MAIANASDTLETAVQLSFENLSTGYLCMRDKQKEAVLAVLCEKDVFVRLLIRQDRYHRRPSRSL